MVVVDDVIEASFAKHVFWDTFAQSWADVNVFCSNIFKLSYFLRLCHQPLSRGRFRSVE
tara:strand:+ start:154 stop:330 length:177 start_codon:yes stop_codon:yes gene_type:complete